MICMCGGCSECLREQRASWREKLIPNFNKEYEGEKNVNTFKENKEKVLHTTGR